MHPFTFSFCRVLAATLTIQRKRLLVQTSSISSVGLSVGMSVGRSWECTVAKRLIGSGCHLGSEWVGRWMGVLDRMEIYEREGTVWGVNVWQQWHPSVTNGEFVA